MTEKSAVFIDGGYLNSILKKNFKEADIDLMKFCSDICDETDTDRLRTYYYHCLPAMRKDHRNRDREKIERMERFLTKLKRLPRFEVKLGRLQIIGGLFKQKMVDVLMSLDITNLCFSGQIKHAILILAIRISYRPSSRPKTPGQLYTFTITPTQSIMKCLTTRTNSTR